MGHRLTSFRVGWPAAKQVGPDETGACSAMAKHHLLHLYLYLTVSRTSMMPDALAALRQAAEAVRAQIPTGGLTLASVEHLLQAAEAVGAAAAATSSPDGKGNPAPRRAYSSKRQEARQRWAEIARRNAQEVLPAPCRAG